MNNLKLAISLVVYMCVSLCSCDTYELDEPGLLLPLTVSEDPDLPSIAVNGTVLHSQAFGNPTNPMMVCVHGGPGADYRGILNFKDLADDGYYVIFYDQRGSGLSMRHPANHYDGQTVQFFIDDLSAVIDHYKTSNDQKLILAGHSWGAMLATAFVNKYPGEADGLILAEPGGFTWPQTEAYIQRSLQLKPFSETTNDLLYFDQIITGSDHETLDYKLTLFLSGQNTGDISLPPFWRPGAVISNWAQKYAVDNPEDLDFTSQLSQYNQKILFAYSENNDSYGKTHAELVSSAYPNVQLEEIKDCGHEIIHFGWNNFYPIVKNYLDEMP